MGTCLKNRFVFLWVVMVLLVPLLSQAAELQGKQVRPAVAAGIFYPKDEATLYQTVKTLLEKERPLGIRGVRAVIVPHAGYVYSGEVAAFSFREVGKTFKRVFVIAANHNGKARFSGFSLPEVSHEAIPGAEIPLSPLTGELLKSPLATPTPEAHTMHMIEAELPFLYFLNGFPGQPGFTLIPMILGDMGFESIQGLAALLNQYADPDTLFVFSIDLSHYYPEAKAQELDQYTIDAVMSRDTHAALGAVTDGNQVLGVLIEMAKKNHWQPSFLKHRTSGYGQENQQSVVGYAAIVFHDPLSLTEIEEKTLLNHAQHVVNTASLTQKMADVDAKLLESFPLLNIPRASFVTLKKNGQLRGCIGNLLPNGPLHGAVSFGAYNATLKDQRFKPVTPDELKDIKTSISVLDYPQLVTVSDPATYLKVLKPLRDGVIIKTKGKSSTYLPQVWEDIPDARDFLTSLCEKQGAVGSCWQDKETKIYRYEAVVFGGE